MAMRPMMAVSELSPDPIALNGARRGTSSGRRSSERCSRSTPRCFDEACEAAANWTNRSGSASYLELQVQLRAPALKSQADIQLPVRGVGCAHEPRVLQADGLLGGLQLFVEELAQGNSARRRVLGHRRGHVGSAIPAPGTATVGVRGCSPVLIRHLSRGPRQRFLRQQFMIVGVLQRRAALDRLLKNSEVVARQFAGDARFVARPALDGFRAPQQLHDPVDHVAAELPFHIALGLSKVRVHRSAHHEHFARQPCLAAWIAAATP